jgi:LuxR family maltose regulon positive regulatory protein
MAAPVLATKLYVPQPRQKIVTRQRLIDRLSEGMNRRLILISAPAGFGKTTLISDWAAGCECSITWLSLDEGDNDPYRFLTYLIAALQTITPTIGQGLMAALQSPQPPTTEAILTNLLNEIVSNPQDFILVLDDYHLVDSQPVDHALAYLLEHIPVQMHLVLATREDPQLPLARYRGRAQISELRVEDLRFTSAEAAGFLNQVMGLSLSAEDIGALEARTEGWIAGLQLAAISMQGYADTAGFIKSFTGSNRFVMDYLVEEVLRKQTGDIQSFLLSTSILERMCGPLCDAILSDTSSASQETLEYLERANLFIIPLDNERCWYRYHHLFGDLLHQRLYQLHPGEVAQLHLSASQWYEDNNLEIEAFHHAVAANDVERAACLVQGKGMPLHLRGGLFPELRWLESLPHKVLDDKPILWLMYAGALTTAGQTTGVEEKLQAAEDALQGADLNPENRDLIGRIANNRATLAITRYEPDEVVRQAQRALEYLHPNNLSVRTISAWNLAVAYQFKGKRAKATRAFTEVISSSQAIGQSFVTKLATCGLGNLQEADNQLHLAAETYQHALELFGDQPLLFATEAYLGLARIYYEWDDLDAAQRYAEQALQLARQYSDTIDRYIVCELFLAKVLLATGDSSNAADIVKKADQSTRQHNFVQRIPEVVAAQVILMLRQGKLKEAATLAQTQDLPVSKARVCLAEGDSAMALEILATLRGQMQAKGWVDELLKVMVLQAVAYHVGGETGQALQVLGESLAMAEEEGFIRSFIDEDTPMAQLLAKAALRGIAPDYVRKLLAAFAAEEQKIGKSASSSARPLIEPLSQRELEILQLIARGLSNRAISERLFLALSTVKGHNRVIFDKLQVQSRTEAISRARELGLL